MDLSFMSFSPRRLVRMLVWRCGGHHHPAATLPAVTSINPGPASARRLVEQRHGGRAKG
jgi:hypothetical protein